MTSYVFEWHDAKDHSNRKKHGVSFEEACLAFEDPNHVLSLDRLENGEMRWQTLGRVNQTLILLVAHLIFENDDEACAGVARVRIISARAATRIERKRYERENRQGQSVGSASPHTGSQGQTGGIGEPSRQ